jgi:outer membrane receptor protein involved in Fe transport
VVQGALPAPARADGSEVSPAAAGVPGGYVGLSLEAALERLLAGGLDLLFSNAVVKPGMKVLREPRASDPEKLLLELLEPHGLTAVAGAKGRWVVVAKSPAPDTPAALPVTVERLLVTTERRESLHGEPIGAPVLDLLPPERDVPHLGNDVFRAAGLLSGVSSTEASSRLSVRGGRSDDVLVVLDGLELIAPYHLPEFDFALGIVAAEALEHVEVISDPYPVEYGDRLGGVLDMRSRTPEGPLGFSLALSTLVAEATVANTFAEGQGNYLATGRAGNYRLALEAADRHENPRFWDLFAKLDYRFRPTQDVQFRILQAGDDFSVPDGQDTGAYDSAWRNSYLWLTHQGLFGGVALAESTVWTGRLHRDRNAADAIDGGSVFDLEDSREFELTGLKSVWRIAVPEARWSVDAGVDHREFHAEIDYLADRRDLGDGIPGIPPTSLRREVARDFDFTQFGGFSSVRWQLAPTFTIEAGLRYDHIGLTDEAHTSPRVHGAWRRGNGTLRVGWGWYYQSQRPYELQVEDGETEVWPAERSEQRLVSWEQRLDSGAGLRVGLFQRLVRRPRPRYESLFDTAALYPELAAGRIRLEPSRGRAQGLELGWVSPPRPRWSASVGYTWARVEDLVASVWIPRATDETHALVVQGRYDLGHDWQVAAVWTYHTGWPTTAITAEVVEQGGEPVPVAELGPVRGDRFPDYHRLDLRLGHVWRLRRGSLSAYLDLQNVYGRSNLRGFENFELSLDADGRAELRRDRVGWGTFQPSFGVRWQWR